MKVLNIPFKSVKLRLTLWYSVVLTVLLSIFAFLMYAELSRALYRDVDKNLLFEAESFVESLQPYVGKATQGVLLPEVRLMEAVKEWEKKTRRISRSHLMVRFAGLDRSFLVSNLKKWEREIIFPDFERDSIFMETGQSFQTIHFMGKPVRLYYHLARFKDHPLFVIQCGAPIFELKSTLQRLSFIILISIPGAVAAACAAGWFLAKRSFQPVNVMIREARQITAAYLKGRLPRTQTGDEVDRLAETLNEMMDRIESSTRAMQEFSSNVSHELKTPLAIMRGEIDLALRKSRTPEALVETLRVIGGEVNELIRLVDDLMLLVRSDARQLRFEMKKISLRETLEQVVGRFQDRAKAKEIQLSGALKKDAEIVGDPVYIKRLFSNLIDNAIKFTPERGRVSLTLHSENGLATVEVQDTGIGIESELQTKVFSRFYRTDQARSHEGSGLGLNIAKAICDAHGGTIQLQSEPHHGTRVTVQLPLA